MPTISGFPCFEVEFTKEGEVFDDAQVTRLRDFVSGGTVTDLVAISHGWNNDLNEARDLYSTFLACVRSVLDRGLVPKAAGRSFAVMTVLWPSKKFADEELIPSGAAALGSAVSIEFVQHQLDRLADAVQDPNKAAPLQRARALVAALPNSPKAQKEFADSVRSALPPSAVQVEDGSNEFFRREGGNLMNRLSKPTTVRRPAAGTGGAASMPMGGPSALPLGSAAGLGQTFSGFLSAARNLLNYSTYYLMKARAETVGRGGVSAVLRTVKAARPDVQVHLVGHSFGGRLVTSVADGTPSQPATVFDTMTLLQAAFSHNGFAEKFDGTRDGAFRGVLTKHKVRGPILVTHSTHDSAVGTWYPIASRIAGQDAAGLDVDTDRFGGMGGDGAQHTPERVVGVLQPAGAAYTFEAGKVYNLNADSIIMEHSDICHDEVAFALLTAIAAW